MQDSKTQTAVFDSEATRFKNKKEASPGPGAYDPNLPVYVLGSGSQDAGFGSQAERDNLIIRDLSKSPFKDPTRIDNPSPNHYHNKKQSNPIN